jgi:hypothetical protein
MMRLRTLCDSSRIAAPDVDRILTDAGSTLTDLVSRGRELSAIGSTMSVSRTIAGDGYEVLLLFDAGIRNKGYFASLLDSVRGR